jgi:quercetin dioxygenase-like cupin family protein
MKLEPEKVITDERRRIVQILTKDIKQINICTPKPGVVLGNHYHKENTEYIFVITGHVCLEIEGKSELLFPGSLAEIPVNQNHCITCTENTNYLIFHTKEFNENIPDIWAKESLLV